MIFSPERDRHIIVNYHYVEDPRADRRGIHPRPCEEFERQVKFLSDNYRLSSIPEVFSFAQNNPQEKVCAITFDDGLKDQYSNAAPILEKYRIPATFFIITGTLEGMIPATHKVHALLSQAESTDLLRRSNEFFDTQYPKETARYRISEDVRLTDKRAKRDDIPTANFKETVVCLPDTVKRLLLDQLLKDYALDEKALSREFFMDASDIKDLYRRGFALGSHAHYHEALDVLDDDQIRQTVCWSCDRLCRLMGKPNILFSYPHGGLAKSGPAILHGAGIEYAVTIDERAVAHSDTPLLLPRYDTATIQSFLISSHL